MRALAESIRPALVARGAPSTHCNGSTMIARQKSEAENVPVTSCRRTTPRPWPRGTRAPILPVFTVPGPGRPRPVHRDERDRSALPRARSGTKTSATESGSSWDSSSPSAGISTGCAGRPTSRSGPEAGKLPGIAVTLGDPRGIGPRSPPVPWSAPSRRNYAGRGRGSDRLDSGRPSAQRGKLGPGSRR